MARFLVDEDLPRSLAPWLNAAGLFAEDVRDRGLRGQPDDDVFRHAVAHGFAVVSGESGSGDGHERADGIVKAEAREPATLPRIRCGPGDTFPFIDRRSRTTTC